MLHLSARVEDVYSAARPPGFGPGSTAVVIISGSGWGQKEDIRINPRVARARLSFFSV